MGGLLFILFFARRQLRNVGSVESHYYYLLHHQPMGENEDGRKGGKGISRAGEGGERNSSASNFPTPRVCDPKSEKKEEKVPCARALEGKEGGLESKTTFTVRTLGSKAEKEERENCAIANYFRERGVSQKIPNLTTYTVGCGSYKIFSLCAFKKNVFLFNNGPMLGVISHNHKQKVDIHMIHYFTAFAPCSLATLLQLQSP